MGSSTLGEVRKCKNNKTNALRAVKILKKEKLGEFELYRFTHEIEMLKRLDHPNIIKLYEIYEDEKRYYLVTELCTGGELFDELTKRENFDEPDVAIVIQ
jgi:calcium-dependent protein kinase